MPKFTEIKSLWYEDVVLIPQPGVVKSRQDVLRSRAFLLQQHVNRNQTNFHKSRASIRATLAMAPWHGVLPAHAVPWRGLDPAQLFASLAGHIRVVHTRRPAAWSLFRDRWAASARQ